LQHINDLWYARHRQLLRSWMWFGTYHDAPRASCCHLLA
jgi:5'-3' exonuclease